MFPRNKIAHLNKMQYIYYICFPALKSHSLRKQLENKSVWRKPWCWPSLAVGPDPARHAHSSTGRQLNLYVGSLRKMTRKRETNFTWTLTSFRHYLRECCSFSLLPTLPSQSCCPYSSKGDLKSWPHKLDQRKHVSRWVDWASCWLVTHVPPPGTGQRAQRYLVSTHLTTPLTKVLTTYQQTQEKRLIKPAKGPLCQLRITIFHPSMFYSLSKRIWFVVQRLRQHSS